MHFTKITYLQFDGNCGKNMITYLKTKANFDINIARLQGKMIASFTGKSLSEALIFASTNPQYDDRLFIELQVQYMKNPSSNLGRTCCVQKFFLTFRTIFVHKEELLTKIYLYFY